MCNLDFFANIASAERVNTTLFPLQVGYNWESMPREIASNTGSSA
jgi:hypothetical protein